MHGTVAYGMARFGMVEKSFEEILDIKYKVHLDSVCEALWSIGYETKKDIRGLSAIKINKNYRFHFVITKLPSGEIDRFCNINLHKDIGKGRFHRVVEKDEDIFNEINLFRQVLSNIMRRKHYNFKKRLKYNLRKENISYGKEI